MLRFIHISDTHLHPDPDYIEEGAIYPSVRVVQALVEQIDSLPFTPDFILHTGDIVYRATPEAYEAVAQMMAKLPAPIHYVAGNLDSAPLIQRIVLEREEAQITPYLTYETEVNGLQLIVLDSNGPAQRPAGNLPDEQLGWLEAICAAPVDRPLIVALHHNPVRVGVDWLDNQMRAVNGERLHQIIQSAGKRLRGVFHGHIHQSIDVVQDGILYTSTASSGFHFDGSAESKLFDLDPHFLPSFSVVTIEADRTFVRRSFVTL
jgi:Icc protein